MNERSWLILRIVASLYVIYLGIKLVVGMLSDKPENMVLMMAAGIFFIVAGAAIVIFTAKDVIKLNKAQQKEEAEAEEETEARDEPGQAQIGSEEVLDSVNDLKEEHSEDSDGNQEVSIDIVEETDKEEDKRAEDTEAVEADDEEI